MALFPIISNIESATKNLEAEGVQALAVGAKDKARGCFDKIILLDPRRETITRVIGQYVSAGEKDASHCRSYCVLASHRRKLDNKEADEGSFQYVLDRMRHKHRKFLQEQQRQVVALATKQNCQTVQSSQVRLPPYDESISEQTALLKSSKGNP